MKKKLLNILALSTALVLLFSGCKTQSGDGEVSSSEPENNNSATGVSVDPNSADYWISTLESPDEILMNEQEIIQYNQSIIGTEGTKCVDLGSYPEKISKSELTALLQEDKPSEEDRYIGERKADSAYYAQLQQNVNLAGVKEENPVRYGYVIDNAPLRTFPTWDPSYEFESDIEFDLFNETVLKVWEPAIILHESTDGKWYYVQSYNYRGWVNHEYIALCEKAEWEKYLSPAEVLVVTGNKIELNQNLFSPDISGQKLFMGTALPLVPESEVPEVIDSMTSESGYAVYFPTRSEEGRLVVKQALVPYNADVSVGYLPYTRRNIVAQAFKLLGDRHGWSGQNESRDASGLSMDVFASFGIRLPRNSSQQKLIPGERIELEGKDDSQKLSELEKANAGDLLATTKHVALYLGTIEGKPYVLHSIYTVYEKNGDKLEEKLANAIVVSDLDTLDSDGNTYLADSIALISPKA